MTRTRLRILHLGFEDYLRPFAGGGSHRTHAVNRVIAERHDVTVLCARYPGARPRTDDGVRYDHIGPPVLPGRTGHFASLLGYFAAMRRAVARADADLIVEDFASPFGSLGVPGWTTTPVVGVVQWLFAQQKAEQYHLPFGRIERRGVARHRTLIAVSDELATQLAAMNPAAQVHSVPNGVDDALHDAPPTNGTRRDFVYLGRLEVAQKGLDVLIDAFARVASDITGDLLLAGDGTDRDEVDRMVRERGLGDRVRLLGRVEGEAKTRLLDDARALVVPSRYETFGLVAAEALARRTPVIAFEIPCLREVVSDGSGVLLPLADGALNAAPLADALHRLDSDPVSARRMGERGPGAVSDYRWSTTATRQEEIYLRALASRSAS